MEDRNIAVGRGVKAGKPVVLLRVGEVEIVLDVDHAEDISLALQKAALDVRQTMSPIPPKKNFH